MRPIKVERVRKGPQALCPRRSVECGGGDLVVGVGEVELAGVADDGRDGPREG